MRTLVTVEKLRCPRCRTVNQVPVWSDAPLQDWATCDGCGYKAVLNFGPLLDKFCIPPVGLSNNEKAELARGIQREVGKL